MFAVQRLGLKNGDDGLGRLSLAIDDFWKTAPAAAIEVDMCFLDVDGDRRNVAGRLFDGGCDGEMPVAHTVEKRLQPPDPARWVSFLVTQQSWASVAYPSLPGTRPAARFTRMCGKSGYNIDFRGRSAASANLYWKAVQCESGLGN